MRGAVCGAVLTALALTLPVHAQQSASDGPPVARQGYLFAGGHYVTIAGKQVMAGQIYAEFQIPKQRTHAEPIVMVHGAI